MENFKDGDYDLSEIANSLDNDFKAEREMSSFIGKNIGSLCKDLGISIDLVRKEYKLNQAGNRARRLDFLIKTTDGEHIPIELKCPTHQAELSYSLGQCLAYITLCKMVGLNTKRLILISSKLDSVVPLVITQFNLPITFIAMDKKKFLTFKKMASDNVNNG